MTLRSFVDRNTVRLLASKPVGAGVADSHHNNTRRVQLSEISSTRTLSEPSILSATADDEEQKNRGAAANIKSDSLAWLLGVGGN